MDIVTTDYGIVLISTRSLAWLDSLDPDWRKISASKRRRGKHAEYVREQVRRFETAVIVASAIAFYAGDELQEF